MPIDKLFLWIIHLQADMIYNRTCLLRTSLTYTASDLMRRPWLTSQSKMNVAVSVVLPAGSITE